MVQFNNSIESHDHSLDVLNLLYTYDSFLDSLESIADFGCGNGLDVKWWATLHTRDDPPEPRNYKIYAVDKDIKKLNPDIVVLPNVFPLERNIDNSDYLLPTPVDFIWCHDVFQFITNPIYSLKEWNKCINVDGMLLISFPQTSFTEYNRLKINGYNRCYINYNLTSLIYMLAVNGFDCKDAYFLKQENDPWLYAAVYKSENAPTDPQTTSWYDLAEKNLLNDSMVESLNNYGYIQQDLIITNWLDKDFHFPKE